ncbi:hypothetical protein GLOIN_2v1773466 [Rhizophagus clarus]|uniref:Uncharacterized protein n=1 Tax=Rhizophagus clarus TaxID=94130 RepID=A0A8H3KS58_9GLOM|nr:hypothetical protein GLOIN_2v1773466 [Rhizophagus clarus]
MTPITKDLPNESSFQPVVSKSQKKKQQRKAKAERVADKANQSDEILIPPPEKKAKSDDKPNTRKVVRNEASTVITGYQPAHNSQGLHSRYHSIRHPSEKKYKTLCVKLEISQFFKNYEKHWMAPLMGFPVRWFPASWSLQERKKKERYQAAVLNPPESMNLATLVHKENEAYLISHNINMFKEVKLPDDKRKIIRYLSNWDDLHRLINNPNVWNGETVDWTRHTPLSHKLRKATKSAYSKSNGRTKSTNAFPSKSNSANPRSVKKVATGTNNIPIRNGRGNASQQQYSSSTKQGKDSPKTEYDDKKHKSKSKRSFTLKKMIMAEITRMNEVLESLLKRTTI